MGTGWEWKSRAFFYCRFGLGFQARGPAREGSLPVIIQASRELSQALREQAYSAQLLCVLSASQWVQVIPTGQESQHEVPLSELVEPYAGWAGVGSAWLPS